MNIEKRRLLLMVSTALSTPGAASASSCGMEDFGDITDPVFKRVERGIVKAAVRGVATGVVLAVGVSLLLPAAGLGTLAFAAGMAIGGGIEILRTVKDSSEQVANTVQELEF